MKQHTGLVVIIVFVLSIVGIYGLVQVYQSGSAPAAKAPAAAPTGGGVALATASTPLGTVVTADGYTLYRFDKDTNKPAASNCKGQCATTWPPVLTPDGSTPAIDGVDPAAVNTVARPDGGTQVTIKGWPLYRFSKDAAPGDTNGEGVGGTWHAIGVDGKPAKAGAAAPAPAAPVAPGAPAPVPAPVPAPAPAPPADSGSYGSGY